MLAVVLLVTSCSWGRFWFTSISLRTGWTDWQSLTKLETGVQVELQMTELIGLLEQTDLVTLIVLTSWLMLLALRTLRTLVERTCLLTVDGVNGWELRTWTLKPKVWTSQIWTLIHLINNFVIALFAWNLRS